MRVENIIGKMYLIRDIVGAMFGSFSIFFILADPCLCSNNIFVFFTGFAFFFRYQLFVYEIPIQFNLIFLWILKYVCIMYRRVRILSQLQENIILLSICRRNCVYRYVDTESHIIFILWSCMFHREYCLWI